MGREQRSRRAVGSAPRWQGFYSARQVSRLVGIPLSTLYEWRRSGVVRPSLQLLSDGEAVDEGYSYADLTLMRILRALRERQLDFDSAAKALHHLYERLGPPDQGWANERVYVVGNRVYADRPDEWEATDASALGQKVATVLFGDLFEELRELEEGASILVPVQFRRYVEINPEVMGGEPVVKGTRIPTSVLAALLPKYKTVTRLARLYEPLPEEAIQKAIEYERHLVERIA